MDEYGGRVLADRYRLPLPPSDEYELAETRAFDTYSGQEVLVRQVPLPEVVEAEVVDGPGAPGGAPLGGTFRGPTDPAVLRAVEAAQAAAAIPDHPRLDQVFDVFAEAGSLWIVSERVAARPLAALLAEKPLTPYRAAEVASDVLTALRVLHAHGWTHRNITARTVLVCDDGRTVLTGLAMGAAEEALCGYAPVPTGLPEERPDAFPAYDDEDGDPYGPGHGPDGDPDTDGAYEEEYGAYEEDGEYVDDEDADDEDGADGAEYGDGAEYEDAADDDDDEGDAYGGGYAGGYGGHPGNPDGADGTDDTDDGGDGRGRYGTAPVRPYGDTGGPGVPDTRGARSGAIAAYRAGARAGARAGEERRADPDWWARRPGEHTPGPFPLGARPDGGAPEGGHPRFGEPGFGDDFGDDDEDTDLGLFRQGAVDDDDTSGEPGRARLAGTWHDASFPGQDGPRPLPAGGGAAPGRPLPAPVNPLPLPAGFGPATEPPALPWGTDPHPYRDSDPYGVRERPADRAPAPRTPTGSAGGSAPGSAGVERPALPAVRSGSASPSGGRYGGAGSDALRADAQRHSPAPPPPPPGAAGAWGEPAPALGAPVHRGPATPLAAERARQARIAVVGAVTERWAPEQAGPVHENWQLAAPVGPATDLWALGALLYRSVQGHAPYPEDNAAELVQLVCSEPPAFAEECGPLRPVVESLLRQDPTERPDFEELRGWLRSLVRSAPEPDAGVAVVPVPPAPSQGSRLPVVRRRGELVRRRRSGSAEVVHGRHRHKKTKERTPRALGRTLLLVVLGLVTAAVAYAVLFLPEAGEEGGERAGSPDAPRATASPAPSAPGGPAGETGGDRDPVKETPTGKPSPGPSRTSGSEQQTGAPAGNLPSGFVLRKDPEGFQVGVDSSWQRRPINDSGQIRYGDGDFTLIVVPGRDSAQEGGGDPLAYQQDTQRELQPYRESSWATSIGVRQVQVGRQLMAEGQYTWTDATGRQVYVRNLVSVVDGRYHVVQVIGPEDRRDEVTEAHRAAVDSYRTTG
ncbi:protein kinase [Streptomyces sp. NPDC000594]|uniref:protein kinase n=1 Tax=Streptomyces sp. NPDC000594 TaxID=3154261 RepID=UPI003332883D